jgi:hypothetical protein
MMKDNKGKSLYENAVNHSYDSQQSRDETTPRIRPWNVNIKSNYGQDDQQDDKDELILDRQRPELSLPSSDDEGDDYEEQYKNSMSSNDTNPDEATNPQQPMTPSRLLTISSIDFYDQNSSSKAPSTEQQQQQNNSKRQISQPAYPQSTNLQSPSPNLEQQQHPTYPSDITGEVDIDAEVKYHDDLIVDSMNQLNLTAQTHFQIILEKLIFKYSNIIQSKDDFIHEQLINHKQSITDLQTLLTNYEHKLEFQSYQQEKMKLHFIHFYQKKYDQHISTHSLRKIFFEWRLVVIRNRRYPHLTRQAIYFYRKHLLSHSFQQIYRIALHSKYQRKLSYERLKSNQQMKEIIQRYETDMAALQIEVKNSFQLLQHEKYSKLHLEENLRRLFLKNMTVMNMDALSLFQESGEISEPLWMTARDELMTTTATATATATTVPGHTATTVNPDHTATTTAGMGEKKRMEMMRRQREQLEHEQYLLEQQSLRNEMRIQQEELMKQQQQPQHLQQLQQQQGTPTATTVKRGGIVGISERRGDQMEQKGRSMKTKKGTSTSVVKKISSGSGTVTGAGTRAASSSPNMFTITGPSFHSKRVVSNESSSSTQQYSQTSSALTQHTSTMVSSSSSSSTVSSSRMATSRFDEKLFNTSSSSPRQSPSPSQLMPQPLPPPAPLPMPPMAPAGAASSLSRADSEDDDDDDPPPQPRRGGPQAIR